MWLLSGGIVNDASLERERIQSRQLSGSQKRSRPYKGVIFFVPVDFSLDLFAIIYEIYNVRLSVIPLGQPQYTKPDPL